MKWAFVAIILAGCTATSTFTGICGMKAIGQNAQGVTFVAAHCEAQK